MAYTAKHHIEHDKIGYAPGDQVNFTADELAAYDQSGTGPVAELLACGAIEGERPTAGASLDEQSVEQLMTIAGVLGITMPVPLDRNTLLAAIVEAKARLAAPVATVAQPNPPLLPVSGFVPTAEGGTLTPSAPAELPALSLDLGLAGLAPIAAAEGVSYPADIDAAALLALIETNRVGEVERRELPVLRSNLSLSRLIEIATAEQVAVADTATRSEVIAAIEAKRAGTVA